MTDPVTVEADAFIAEAHKALIGGKWVSARSGETLPVLNPATAREIAQIPACDARDVDLAVRAARRSFDAAVWRGLAPADRTALLFRFADLIEAQSEVIARIDVIDNGMPIWLARAVMKSAVQGVRYCAMLAAVHADANLSGAASSPGQPMHAYTASGPIGVAALVTPWNGPASAFLIKVAPALAAGCSCVVKPAEATSLSALYLARLALEAGMPDGVLNVVTGLGPVAGQALVAHPLVDKISFTGSTAVGKNIVRAAADDLRRVTLELGGKSPNIILDDADLDRAIPSAAMGVFLNTGQVCIAGSRLFVQRKVYDRVVAGIAEVARTMAIGSGLDAAVQLGPVISATQRDRINAHVEQSRCDGAEVIVAGVLPALDGYFVPPIILANVKRSHPVMHEEVFGPVVVATPFDEIDEAVAAANDTRYGLAAGLFTSDLGKAHTIADRLEAGNVWINCYGITHPMLPFGGFRESGWGREFGADGLDVYRQKKSVAIAL